MVDLDALEAAAKAATQGEWEWWNGSSWWRLGVNDRNRSRVIEPYTASDGHPDLIVSPEDRAYTVAAQPRVMLDLIAELRAAREALEQIAVYGCGMLNQPATVNGPEEAWLRRRIAQYERTARAALAGDRHEPCDR